MPGATCTLTATVHSERNLGGYVLQTLSVSFTVTASFEALPSKHDSESVFTFNVRFSEALASKRAAVRSAFTVTGGSVTGQMRVNGQSDLWRIKIRPSSHGDVSIALPANVACNAGGLCTADGDVLSNALSATVQGPVALSVADARVHEAANATLDFVVSLSRAALGPVTVDYATSDGTATAGGDYMATSGTLSFAPGETSRTVPVSVLDDLKDEGAETFTLSLSNATGAHIEDAEATGTVSNSDPLQKMWLSRFGRTVAGHVVDAVGERLRGGSGGSHVTIAGRRLSLATGSEGATALHDTADMPGGQPARFGPAADTGP